MATITEDNELVQGTVSVEWEECLKAEILIGLTCSSWENAQSPWQSSESATIPIVEDAFWATADACANDPMLTANMNETEYDCDSMPLDDQGINPLEERGERFCSPPVPLIVLQEYKRTRNIINKPRKRKRPNNDVPPEQRVYTFPTDADVCLGRGGWTNKHPGNRQFHAWKTLLEKDYVTIERKLDRTPVAERLLDLVHQHRGRFLKRDTKGWYEVNDKKAREKCSQVLRDAKISDADRKLKRLLYPKKKKTIMY